MVYCTFVFGFSLLASYNQKVTLHQGKMISYGEAVTEQVLTLFCENWTAFSQTVLHSFQELQKERNTQYIWGVTLNIFVVLEWS